MKRLATLALCLSLGCLLLGCNLNPQPFPPSGGNDNATGGGGVCQNCGTGGGGSGGGGGASSEADASVAGPDAGVVTVSPGIDSSAPVVADASVDRSGPEMGAGLDGGAGGDASSSCVSCPRPDGSSAEAGSTDDSSAEASTEDDASGGPDAGDDAASGTAP